MSLPPERPAPDIGPIGPWEVLAFLCELGLLAALAVTGWAIGSDVWSSLTRAIALPVVFGGVWGRWFAPRASRRLGGRTLSGAKVAVYVAIGTALAFVAERPVPAAVLVVLGCASAVLSAEGRGRRPTRSGSAAGP